MNEPDLLFTARSHEAVNSFRTFYTGSSEFVSGEPSVPQIINLRLNHSEKNHPVFLGASGPAIWRGAWFLWRLKRRNLAPAKLVIFVNPSYAQSGYNPDSSNRDRYFPDSETFSIYSQIDSSLINAPVNIKGRLELSGSILQSYIRIYRRNLHTIFAKPVNHFLLDLLNNSRSAASTSPPVIIRKKTFPSSKVELEMETKRIKMPDASSVTDFTRSLEFLKKAAEENKTTEIVLLVQPLNREYYRKLGMNPHLNERRYIETIKSKVKDSSIQIRVIHELNHRSLFTDSVHFNRRGREMIADTVIRVL